MHTFLILQICCIRGAELQVVLQLEVDLGSFQFWASCYTAGETTVFRFTVMFVHLNYCQWAIQTRFYIKNKIIVKVNQGCMQGHFIVMIGRMVGGGGGGQEGRQRGSDLAYPP